MHEFMPLIPVSEALGIWTSLFHSERVSEEVSLMDALGRVTSRPVVSPENLPGFARSTVDGYAVASRDTFGASEGLPALLNLAGEVSIGREAGFALMRGHAAWVPTGGMIPSGSDAVVMLEHTETLGDIVQAARAVAPGENVLGPSEDVAQGSVAIAAGRRLGPGEIGLMAALGLTVVPVVRRPRVTVLSTGDEIVPAENRPAPGQVRDINRYTVSALVIQGGGAVIRAELLGDDPDALTAFVAKAATDSDLIVLSGGSSVGNRDFTLQAINRAGTPGVVIHGVAIRPGKPTVLGVVSGVPVLGLPGHPASAMIAWRLFGRPALDAASGTSSPVLFTLRARLAKNLPSAAGREDFYRVRLIASGEGWQAEPVLGKSGLISTMSGIDAILRIPPESEGLQAGDTVEVEPV